MPHTAWPGYGLSLAEQNYWERIDMATFGVMPFEFDTEGKVVFGKPRQVSSELGARCLAAAMVATSPGAVVFSKSESEPPKVVIVARYGVGADTAVTAAT
jgi:hypothetical protein